MIKKIFLVVLLALVLVIIYLLVLQKKPNIINVKKLGPKCSLVKTCGGISVVDCGAAVDGPAYYIDSETGKILEYCGGYCQSPGGKSCRNCPPKEWEDC